MRALSALLTRPGRLDLLAAVGLTVAGELEVLLGPAGGGSRLVSALALPLVTLALAWRRTAALAVLAAVVAVLLVQVPLGGFLLEHPVSPLVAAVLALYSAGRHLSGAVPWPGPRPPSPCSRRRGSRSTRRSTAWARPR